MVNKLKLMTILGTRPEIIRLSELIRKADLYFDHILVHTGQNYDYSLNEQFFDEMNIRKPDVFLDAVGKDLGETMGNIISKSYDLIKEVKPDAILILGDTNSSLASISAKRLKTPIFHMEAGNRCFDENLPEEINRRIVDHISDINLPYTEHARRNLISEGLPKDRIFVTGSPMREVLNKYQEEINQSKVLNTLGLEKGKYFIVSAHREENIDNDKNFQSLMKAINAIAEKYKYPVIYSCHPRSKKKIEEKGIQFHTLVQEMKPFGFFDYNYLQKNAYCVVSDSGTVPEESAIIGFPAVSIRTSTERPESFDKGQIVLAGINENEIFQAIDLEVRMYKNKEVFDAVNDYEATNVSAMVLKTIQSYTKIINTKTWHKE